MNEQNLIELNETEVDQVSGGLFWMGVAAAIFVAGAVVEGYNAYKEAHQAAHK